MKATFDVDDDLYGAIRVEAARLDRSVRDIVEEALEAWLAKAEETEDLAAAGPALEEYRRDGDAAAESWLAERAAESGETNAPDGG